MYEYDFPKLRTPLLCLIAAAFFLAAAVKGDKLPDWARLGAAGAALVFAIVGIVSLADWIANHAAGRLREINEARTCGAVALANALKGLTLAQTQAVMAGEKVAMRLIPGDDEPALYIQGMTEQIPWDFAQEFLTLSMETDPFLYPVRQAGNERYATDLTNLIKARGWATTAVSNTSARLTKPLRWVAARFWVELPEVIENA
jgi:hypothetical protein